MTAVRTASRKTPDLLVDRAAAAGSETLLSAFLFHLLSSPLPLLQNDLKSGKKKVTHFPDRDNRNHAWVNNTNIWQLSLLVKDICSSKQSESIHLRFHINCGSVLYCTGSSILVTLYHSDVKVMLKGKLFVHIMSITCIPGALKCSLLN